MSTVTSILRSSLVLALPALATPLPADASSPRDSVTELNRIVVTAQKPAAGTEIDVAQAEQGAGLKEDVGALLYLQPGVERIPEAGSALLINGQGLYDSRYLVFGVPMMSAAHFAGHSFCDRGGVMVPSVNKLSLHTRDLAGSFSDAPGGVVEVDPGIARYADLHLKPRPEIAVNISALYYDILLSTPMRDGKDTFQISAKLADAYTIGRLNNSENLSPYVTSRDATLGLATPYTYGDGIITGSTSLGKLTLREYGWLAINAYGASENATTGTIVPWGMAGLRLGDSAAAEWSLDIGGSHEPFYEGKKFGPVIPLKKVLRTNAIARYATPLPSLGSWNFDATASVELVDWKDTLTARWAGSADTLYDSLVTASQEQKEARIEAHGGVQRVTGLLHWGGDVLAGVLVPAGRAYVDPGLWTRLALDRVTAEIRGGIQTSQPDIRGMPSERYRGSLSRTYSGDLRCEWAPWSWFSANGSGYVRYADRCPSFSARPWEPVWDPGEETALLSRGVNGEVTVRGGRWLEIASVQQFSRSERRRDGRVSTYEWDLPWSNKSLIHLKTLNQRLHLYLTGVVAAGLPYRDLRMDGGSLVFAPDLLRSPVYKRVDVKLQYNQDVSRARYLTRFEVYAELNNVLNFASIFLDNYNTTWENTREYYWDVRMEKKPILLDYFRTNIGARIGFRL